MMLNENSAWDELSGNQSTSLNTHLSSFLRAPSIGPGCKETADIDAN